MMNRQYKNEKDKIGKNISQILNEIQQQEIELDKLAKQLREAHNSLKGKLNEH